VAGRPGRRRGGAVRDRARGAGRGAPARPAAGGAEPLLSQAEDEQRHRLPRVLALAPGQAGGPLLDVLVRRAALEQLPAGGGEDRTVVAVDDLAQLGAGAVAADADAVPAVVEGRQLDQLGPGPLGHDSPPAAPRRLAR